MHVNYQLLTAPPASALSNACSLRFPDARCKATDALRMEPVVLAIASALARWTLARLLPFSLPPPSASPILRRQRD